MNIDTIRTSYAWPSTHIAKFDKEGHGYRNSWFYHGKVHISLTGIAVQVYLDKKGAADKSHTVGDLSE